MSGDKPRLLALPLEIRLQIWEYAFGNTHIPLYCAQATHVQATFNDFPYCEACLGKPPQPRPSMDGVSQPQQRYNDIFERLLVCKSITDEAIEVFQSQLTLHIKSPEAIAFVRHTAPNSFRKRVSKIIIYLHFDRTNHSIWCMRLFELHETFPNLKHLAAHYHMRPPVSYDNLLDAIYFAVPMIGLNAPFNAPLYIIKEDGRADARSTFHPQRPDSIITIPITDARPGLTIHTGYITEEILFEAHFLGSITTQDAIEEHTSIIRALFHDPAFLAAAHQVIQSNSAYINSSVSAAHGPNLYPPEILELGWQNETHLPAIQYALLHIARRYERPWFEKLQRRRIVEVYVEQGGMTQIEAEALLTRQLAEMPAGQGIDEFMEQMIINADGDEGMTEALSGSGDGAQDEVD